MSETKTLRSVQVKDADQGIVEAIFATLNVKDSDGDVTVPGAFTEGAPVRISAYGHGTWSGELPVGKGTIHEEGDVAICRAQFFLNTTPGRDTFETIKEMGDLQEWSYGFDVLEAEDGDVNGEKVRVLKKLDVFEVSPVLLGAGVGTRTLVAKAKKAVEGEVWNPEMGAADLMEDVSEVLNGDAPEPLYYCIDVALDQSAALVCSTTDYDEAWVVPITAVDANGDPTLAPQEQWIAVEQTWVAAPKSLTFVRQAELAAVSINAMLDRSKALADLRAKEGRVLSAANRDRLATLLTAMGEASTALRSLLEETDPGKSRNELIHEAARFEAAQAALLGGK